MENMNINMIFLGTNFKNINFAKKCKKIILWKK